MKIGRNDPCPCGSGKKHKKCCLDDGQSEIVEDLGYRRFRSVERSLVPRLFSHAAEVFGPGSIEEAWDEFHCWNGPQGFDPASPLNQIFGPYFLFSWEIDPADPECDASLQGKTVAESFLDANRALLSRDALTFLEAANRPVFSFFEIKSVSPGQGMTLCVVTMFDGESRLFESHCLSA